MAQNRRMTWEEDLPRYRSQWEQRATQRGCKWGECEQDYRYGWETRQDPRYSSRSWAEAEPELRRDWESRSRAKPWSHAAEHVRDAWETIQLREEELRPAKETVQAGEVGIRKEVVSEQKTVEVPVTREEVVVERHPVGRRPADSEIGTGAEESVRVPLREERAHLEKETVVAEELSVGKREVEERERLSGTVRREEARVETEGDVHTRGEGREGRRDR